jgi:L-alanine-DL-glutamate epimerase-like enolase superfamily enzyme
MPFTCRPLPLPLQTPFRTAHGASEQRTNAFVTLDDGEHTFFGEGALPPYYPHDVEDVARYVETLDPDALLAGPPFALDAALARLPADGPAPARCAVDLTLHDRWARALGRPLYELLGLDPSDAPSSSVTLSLPDDLDTLRERARAHRSAPVLKLKLGADSIEKDEQAVRIVQEEIAQEETGPDNTGTLLGVDANEAWTVEDAATIIPRLAGLLFVEEPIRERDPEAWHRLHEQLSGSAHPPLIADESVQEARDIARLAPWVDGINVKLAKAGGLAGARQWIATARALELQVLLGCMIESSLAVTAAAHLAPLADFADLDGALSLTDDPFDGVQLRDGRLHLPDRPGLGVERRGA